VDALTQPWVLFLLMMIGFSAFYAEMQHPGTGVGGFVATICFLLFFWGTYLGGTADWLEILLFIVGVVFILLEVFVLPGFGIFGVGGGLMIAASLVLALQTFSGLSTAGDYLKSLRGSLLMVVGAGAAVTGLVAALRYYLPRKPKLNQGLVLTPPGEEEGETPPQGGPYDHLLRSRGKVVTRLTPAGKVRIGDQHVDVVSEGEWIDRGAEVVVVQVQGNRIVVRPAERGST
jgi:membrane-bound ClpP family serine protease